MSYPGVEEVDRRTILEDVVSHQGSICVHCFRPRIVRHSFCLLSFRPNSVFCPRRASLTNKPGTLPAYELQVEVRLSLFLVCLFCKDGIRASLGFEHIPVARRDRLHSERASLPGPHKALQGSPCLRLPLTLVVARSGALLSESSDPLFLSLRTSSVDCK